jgi:toxin ParE1/3/4
MRVRYTLRARNDLVAIFEYLDVRSPQGASNVKRSIRKAVELIGQFPHGGRRTHGHDTRVLPAGRYPYLIYWSVEAGDVWLLHIRHTARRPWKGGN